jgi:predicted Zn-dependent peptidase
MHDYQLFSLKNGLKIYHLPAAGNPLAVVNIMYNVGSRDEEASKTGFAHLFEHLMFGGSINILSYDEPLQMVGGENNAFTNTDITNYYIQLPVENLETAFWLESDRMLSLDFSQKSLDVQKGVVVEEFRQRYLNQPYGDAMHHLRDLAYKKHPYRWPTIGLETSHIENAVLQDVKDFFFHHYRPNNAVMVVAADLPSEHILELSEKWFGSIEAGEITLRNLPEEDPQTEGRRKEVSAKVPMHAIYLAWPMAERMTEEFYSANLLSDILGHGKSSRLVNTLVKEERIFHSISAYVSGSMDPGLFTIEGKLNQEHSPESAEKRLWEELLKLQQEGFSAEEVEKVKNQSETALAGAEIEMLNRCINLAYFALCGKPEDYRKELEKVQQVSRQDIEDVFRKLIRAEKCNTLIYRSQIE